MPQTSSKDFSEINFGKTMMHPLENSHCISYDLLNIEVIILSKNLQLRNRKIYQKRYRYSCLHSPKLVHYLCLINAIYYFVRKRSFFECRQLLENYNFIIKIWKAAIFPKFVFNITKMVKCINLCYFLSLLVCLFISLNCRHFFLY